MRAQGPEVDFNIPGSHHLVALSGHENGQTAPLSSDEVFAAHEALKKVIRAEANQTPEVIEALAVDTLTYLGKKTIWQEGAVDSKTYPRDNLAAVRRGRMVESEDDESVVVKARKPDLPRTFTLQEGLSDWEDELLAAWEDYQDEEIEEDPNDTSDEAWYYDYDAWDDDSADAWPSGSEEDEALWWDDDADPYGLRDYDYDLEWEEDEARRIAGEENQAWEEHRPTQIEQNPELDAPTDAEPSLVIGRGVISNHRSYRERTRDSIGTWEERDAERREARHRVSVQRKKRYRKTGVKHRWEAADGYLPGGKPPKYNPWNMAVAQEVLLEEHDLTLGGGGLTVSPRIASLLTKGQANDVHMAWDTHDIQTKASATEDMSAMFARHETEVSRERMRAYAEGIAEAMDFNDAEGVEVESVPEQGLNIKPDIVAMRERQTMQARRRARRENTLERRELVRENEPEPLIEAA